MNEIKDGRSFGRKKQAVLHQSQAYSAQAEQALIGALLESPLDVYDQLAGKLKAEYFLDPFCKLAFEKAMTLIADGNKPDMIMLAACMDGYVSMDIDEIESELADIYEKFPSSSNVQGWCLIVLDKHIQRQLESTGERLKELAHAQDFSAEEKVSEAGKMLAEASAAMSSDTVMSTEDMVLSTLSKIEERMANVSDEPAGLSFGFSELDDATTGMHAAELIIVAGRPGMGKTAFAMAMAKAIAAHSDKTRRSRVLMFSLEMSAEQMGMRWLSSLYDVPVANMRSGRVTPDEWSRLNAGMAQAKDFLFDIDKNASVAMEQLMSISRKVQRESGLGMVVVDYLQLITTSSRGNANRTELIGEISRQLKNLSRELGIPVVALSQLNRALEQRQDKRPMLSDLRESGSIEQDADLILFLYRDDYYNKNSNEPGIAEIIIAKQRNGQPCTVKLGWNGPTTSFTSLAGSTDRSFSTSQSIAQAYDNAENCPF